MIGALSVRAWEDYQHWIKDGKSTLKKLNGLIKEGPFALQRQEQVIRKP